MRTKDATRTNLDLFAAAIALERGSGALFSLFERLFAHDREAQAVWARLKKDEEHHAAELSRIRDSLSDEDLASAVDVEAWESIEKARRLLRAAGSRAMENLDDAYETAHELEFSEFNSVFTFLASRFVSSAERKRFLLSEILSHQNYLADFGRASGGRAGRKLVKAAETT